MKTPELPVRAVSPNELGSVKALCSVICYADKNGQLLTRNQLTQAVQGKEHSQAPETAPCLSGYAVWPQSLPRINRNREQVSTLGRGLLLKALLSPALETGTATLPTPWEPLLSYTNIPRVWHSRGFSGGALHASPVCTELPQHTGARRRPCGTCRNLPSPLHLLRNINPHPRSDRIQQ